MIWEEFHKFNNNKTDIPFQKWAKEMKRQLGKNEMKMANRHRKKNGEDHLSIREMQIKP